MGLCFSRLTFGQRISLQRAIATTKWKQYTTNGKTYFVNAVTKETQVSGELVT